MFIQTRLSLPVLQKNYIHSSQKVLHNILIKYLCCSTRNIFEKAVGTDWVHNFTNLQRNVCFSFKMQNNYTCARL